ncbi:MAG: hypothetical protein IJ468_09105 [Lachnospiraceae bacterium]|nr:hypothetical protein [Lachnospiraceae bacterium]
MPYQRQWWSGHELYGVRPQKYRFRDPMFQEIPYIELSAANMETSQLEYWKSLYPQRMRKIQDRIEEVCEQLEYDDSPMYDEYPDRVFLRRLCNEICDGIDIGEGMQDGLLMSGKEEGSWMRECAEVLLYQEIHRRRCERRNCRRRLY